MRRLAAIVTALALALAFAAPPAAAAELAAHEESRTARHADIRKLMGLTGAGQLGVQAARQMLSSLRQVVPEAPEEFWRGIEARLDPDDLIEMMIPVYARHLSASDVKELVRFYESPLGRKLTAAQPQILADSMAVGEQWGARIAADVIQQARASGFEVKAL